MKNAPNKMVSNKDVQEYHFAGTGVHPPISITASSQEEAREKYNQKIGLVIVKDGYESEEKKEKKVEADIE